MVWFRFLSTSILLFSNTLAQLGESDGESSLEYAYPDSAEPAAPTPSSSYYDGVWAKVSPGITTECKVCPYSLCSNKNFYGSLLMFRAVCWTNGQRVNSTTMWLKSEEDCYVTVQDTLKYWRNYTEDIRSCGYVPEQVTSRRTTARAAAECKRCPNANCDTVKNYERRNEVILTCRAQSLPGCLGDCVSADIPPVNESTVFPWYKTNANCYVPANSITPPRSFGWGRQSRPLPDCGPVPFLDSSFRAPPPITVTTTVTVTVTVPTTIILRPPPCTDCPPLIYGYTPPLTLATTGRPAPSASPGSVPPFLNASTTPSTNWTGIAQLPHNSDPPITPTSSSLQPPVITTSLTLPPITLTSSSSQTPITITSSSSQPPVITSNLTLPPITFSPSRPLVSPVIPISPNASNSTSPTLTLTFPSTSSTSSSPTLTITFPSTSSSPTLTLTFPPTSSFPISSSTSTLTFSPTPPSSSNPSLTLTLPPSSSPITITLNSTSNPSPPIITLTPSTTTPPAFTSNITLPPITVASVQNTSRSTESTTQPLLQVTPKPAQCTCSPVLCSGAAETQSLCSRLAAEQCVKTCSAINGSPSSDPFKPLMSDTGGGRPPPVALGETYFPGLEPWNGKDLTAEIAASISAKAQVPLACRLALFHCPQGGDEAIACSEVRSAGYAALCGNMPSETQISYQSTTVMTITQVISPSPIR